MQAQLLAAHPAHLPLLLEALQARAGQGYLMGRLVLSRRSSGPASACVRAGGACRGLCKKGLARACRHGMCGAQYPLVRKGCFLLPGCLQRAQKAAAAAKDGSGSEGEATRLQVG